MIYHRSRKRMVFLPYGYDNAWLENLAFEKSSDIDHIHKGNPWCVGYDDFSAPLDFETSQHSPEWDKCMDVRLDEWPWYVCPCCVFRETKKRKLVKSIHIRNSVFFFKLVKLPLFGNIGRLLEPHFRAIVNVWHNSFSAKSAHKSDNWPFWA